MEPWLERAFDYFPEKRRYWDDTPNIDWVSAPFDLWIELEGNFNQAIETGHEALQRRIIDYLRECTSGRFGDASSPIQQAVYCGFLWYMGRRPDIWHLLPRWFSREEFERYKSEIALSLDADERTELERTYRMHSHD